MLTHAVSIPKETAASYRHFLPSFVGITTQEMGYRDPQIVLQKCNPQRTLYDLSTIFLRSDFEETLLDMKM